VSTLAARFQDISLNPQKLAGQCAKLKCCLNYEVDAYVEASKRLPQRDIELETVEGTYYFFKADILKGELTYSSDKRIPANLKTITSRRAKHIIEMNKRGEKPESLLEDDAVNSRQSADLLEQNNIDRFDNTSRNKKRKRSGGNREYRNDSNKKGKKKENPKSE
jgi:hypothetical protein